MSLIDALRSSSKGRLQYEKHLNLEKLKLELDQLSPPPLSKQHTEKESSKKNLSFGLSASDFENISNNKTSYSDSSFTDNGKSGSEKLVIDQCGRFISPKCAQDESGQEKSDTSKEDVLDLSEPLPDTSALEIPHTTPINHAASCPVSPEFGLSSCAILEAEERWDSRAKLSQMEKRMQFEDHHRALKLMTTQKWKAIKDKLAKQAENRQTSIDKKAQEGLEESKRSQQRLKENHEQHQKKINTKNREIERQREMMEEEERKRQEVITQKIQQLQHIFQQIDANKSTFIKLQEGFSHKDQLHELVGKYRTALENMTSNSAILVQKAEQSLVVSDELIAKFEENKDKSQHAVDYLKKQIADAEAKLKVDEDKRKEEEQKKAEAQEKKTQAKKLEEEAANDTRVQALSYVLREQSAKAQKLAEVETQIKDFVGNAEMKKYRFDLQRAVNTPINAISGISGSHLRDKLERIFALLSGRSVAVSGKRVSAKDAPQSLLFCQHLVAKMLVRKGEEQVTSKHESAFAIGAMVIGVWVEFPIVGELFMAHLQALCPYVLPFYATQKEGQSNLDYYKSLGYKVGDDGTIEEQDKFLRRMSGMMRLYCACLVATPPKGANSPHPQGLEHAWMWLSRTMNLEPHPDITAALIHDVLAVTGHALFHEYRTQFAKLLWVLYKVYLPKLKNVSVTNATVGRLELFLEKALKEVKIPLPEGYLGPNFWYS